MRLERQEDRRHEDMQGKTAKDQQTHWCLKARWRIYIYILHIVLPIVLPVGLPIVLPIVLPILLPIVLPIVLRPDSVFRLCVPTLDSVF